MYIKLFFLAIFLIFCSSALPDISFLEKMIVDIILFIVLGAKIIVDDDNNKSISSNTSKKENSSLNNTKNIVKEINKNNAEEKTKNIALEELKKGNPEPYEMEYNELEDDMFHDYDDDIN